LTGCLNHNLTFYGAAAVCGTLISFPRLELPAADDLLVTTLEGELNRHEYTSHHKCTFAAPDATSATPPPFCTFANKSQESLAKVEMPQAKEMSYHQKGTFHWDPFINSSELNATVSGALTLMVQHYLTHHWT
jgi:hypothetical protein